MTRRSSRGNPMNHSEVPEYDDDFPDHPLTLVRRFVRELVENNKRHWRPGEEWQGAPEI